MFVAFVALILAVDGCAAIFFLLQKLRFAGESRQQVVFVRETLAASPQLNEPRIIVSLTTLPDRMANLQPTLDCLCLQTRLPDEIVIAIPEIALRQQQRYVLPPFLREYPRIRILQAERDWGPATKSIPAIRDEMAAGRLNTAIVVVDDDRIYPCDAIETYLHFERELPDAALCFRGAAMPRSFDWRDAKMIHGNRLRQPVPVAVVTGCGSYLIKPRFFDETLWDYSSAPRAAFYMDDIWISGCLDRRGVSKYVVPSSDRLRSVKQQERTMTLHDVPRGRQHNNNEVIAFFHADWNVFPEA